MTKEFVQNNLRQIRNELGISCQELADILGVSKVSVSNWERQNPPMNDVTAYGIIYVIENILSKKNVILEIDNNKLKKEVLPYEQQSNELFKRKLGFYP